MPDILSEICAAKRTHVRRRQAEQPENALLKEAQAMPAPRGFTRVLKERTEAGDYGLIAEIKKASPSKGTIREDFRVGALAKAYEKGGAACLSVLTDAPYFQGNDAYLAEARKASALPVLRKDFMLEPYQIIESRCLSADCALLIMAALSDQQASELMHVAATLALDVLVEVHDQRELERALTHLNPQMVGINNRDLKTFETSLTVSERLAKMLPRDILAVAESGIFTHEDIRRLQASHIRCFLVGESLMRERDVEAATRTLLGK